MTALQSWFKRQHRRNRFFVSLYDMVFNNQISAYAIYRLRYYALIVSVRFIFHFVMFLLLWQNLSGIDFFHLVYVWIFCELFIGAWWGALEVLRTKVRYLYYGGFSEKISKELGFWFIFSLIFGLLFVLASGFILLSALQVNPGSLSVSMIYMSVLLFGAGFQIVASTYHSGVYGVRRVFRTPLSLVIPEIVGLIVLIGGLFVIGLYALPLSALVGVLISVWLTYHFTKRTYFLLEFKISLMSVKEFLAKLIHQPWMDFGYGKLAMLLIRFDSLLLLLIAIFFQFDASLDELFFVIFLLSPIVRSGYDWAQLFYFDWKRAENMSFKRFIDKFNRQVNWISVAVGFIVGVVIAIFVYDLISFHALTLSLVLIPLFALRSFIAYRQMAAFAMCRYYDVFISGIATLALIGTALLMSMPISLHFLMTLAGLLLILWYLVKPRLPSFKHIKKAKLPIVFYNWLYKLKNEKSEQIVCRLDCIMEATGLQKRHIMMRIVDEYLKKSGEVCLLNHRHILFYCRVNDFKEILEGLTAGLVVRQFEAMYTPNQTDIAEMDLLKDFMRLNDKSLSKQALRDQFFKQFPKGICYDPNIDVGPEATQPHFQHPEQLLQSANAWLRGNFQQQNSKEAFVSTLYDKDTIDTIFVVPVKTYSFSKINRWTRRLQQYCTLLSLPHPPA